MSLAFEAFEESRYAALPFAGQRTAAAIQDLLMAGEKAALLLAERSDRHGRMCPAGALIASLAELRFADFVTARVLFFFVSPTHRRSNAAIRLLSEFKLWARENKAADISVSITMGGKEDNRVAAFLARKGFEVAGDNMYKPLLPS